MFRPSEPQTLPMHISNLRADAVAWRTKAFDASMLANPFDDVTETISKDSPRVVPTNGQPENEIEDGEEGNQSRTLIVENQLLNGGKYQKKTL